MKASGRTACQGLLLNLTSYGHEPALETPHLWPGPGNEPRPIHIETKLKGCDPRDPADVFSLGQIGRGSMGNLIGQTPPGVVFPGFARKRTRCV